METNDYSDLPKDKRQLAAAFAAVRPANLDPGIRDRLMFQAGRRSSARRRIFWQATAAMFAVVLGLSFYLRMEPDVATAEPENVYTQVPKKSSPDNNNPTLADTMQIRREYVDLCNEFLDEGSDALPEKIKTQTRENPGKAGYLHRIEDFLE
ncbi:MAG: hypothetical protein JEZ07_10010 [Phycisphaerae bacterium]|nr:hypothetical protein [Phycisphaerae bacterium]